MAAFREFEIAAIRLMAQEPLTPALLEFVVNEGVESGYEYTGCGYFLTVRHPGLPKTKKTLSVPAVVGTSGEVQAGFVVFLGDGALVLECHTWGAIDVPEDFRDRQVDIGTPVIQTIGGA